MVIIKMCNKPELILQIDCDSEYVMQTHYGLPLSQENTYYSALDKFLNRFQRAGLKSTLFVVGKDVENKNVQRYIWKAVDNGCEIANHSYDHCNHFSAISYEEFKVEVQKTNHIISSVFDISCKGFRAPNFDMNPSYIKILRKEGIKYDCSLLSTPFLPLIKLLKGIEANRSGYLGNTYWNPQKPYVPDEIKMWKAKKIKNCRDIIEIPITTFPYLRFPCHFSYLLTVNFKIAKQIMKTLINWHVKRREALVFVFHLADLVDNKLLYGIEQKCYKSLEERLFLLDCFVNMVGNSFNSLTTLEYYNLIKAGVYEL